MRRVANRRCGCAAARFFVIALLCIGARVAHADDADANSAAVLRAKYDGIQHRFDHSLVERNTMRYYLAIEAFLGTASAPAPERLERRLRDWFAAIERYPRQLHEMEQGEYLDMKRKEYLRQQSGLQPPPA